MANSDEKPPARSAARQQRLASALRANLHRRKAAARAAAKPADAHPGRPGPDDQPPGQTSK